MQKTAPSIIASIALLALFASPAVAAPNPGFTVSPSPPRCGDQATYTDASTVDALLTVAKVEWDFNNDGTYDVVDDLAPFTANHTYSTRGSKTFGMRVTDNNPADAPVAEDQTVSVVTDPPEADFTPSDAAPQVNDEVLFASDVSDPDGDAINSFAWDFDDDGTTDSTARNPVHQFTSPGPQTVTLKVTDSCGAPSTVAEHVINVLAPSVPNNALPIARFAFSPRTAQVEDPVEFVSSSFDRDGEVKEEAWDLDGDGQFDDARGDDVLYTFTTPGEKTVRLRVTDSAGATSVAVRQVTVTKPPKPPPGFMRPSPRVRFNGLILRLGMRMQILGVRGPRGALATVRCHGKSCPAKQRRKRIQKRPVRFHNFERFLRHGVKLEFFITKRGTIGTYRRYTIRAGKPPLIRDRCLNGTKLRPVKC